MSYQSHINDIFSSLNNTDLVYPIYPPYHKGLYLEEIFCKNPKKNKDRYLIPVNWTNIYKQKKETLLQEKINQLNPDEKYYCVCTHDDAPKETLPKDTLVYSAGGNNTKATPIPLVVSKVPSYTKRNKDIYASFVGSYTHPIRLQMAKYTQHTKFVLSINPQWSETVQDNQFKFFEEVSSRSQYILCPRGYGTTSYRMYEAFQYKAVPVYISDKFWLPWENQIDWNKLIIRITPGQIPSIKDILSDYDDRREAMIQYASKVYEDFFSLEGVVKRILS